MGLRDEAAALSKRPGTQQSAIMRLIGDLDGDERDELIALIWDDEAVASARAAAEAIEKYHPGRGITDQQIQSHRRKPRP